MANCSKLFSSFNAEISIGSTKKNKMISSKDGLRRRIRKWFKENQPEYEPKFFIQGSHKMGLGIRTKDDICDLDDGVYFFRAPDVTSTTIQGWIWYAVKGYTDTDPEHRSKCVRSIFTNDYEIDHPVYYKIDGEEYKIAVKNEGWNNSDPKAMVEWYRDHKDKEGRLNRAIMDLKAWCDHKRNRMPNGLAMTILATNAKSKIVLNERDDITLRDILREIKKAMDVKFECVVPVSPQDDLFGDYSQTRKDNFLNALEEFLEDADKAIQEPNELEASKLWRKHLGTRFPEGEDKEEEKSRSAAAIATGAATSRPWANA